MQIAVKEAVIHIEVYILRSKETMFLKTALVDFSMPVLML
jgi:hypothetical protein